MGRPRKHYTCSACGAGFRPSGGTKNRSRCTACNIAHAAEQNAQMRAKNGIMYEQWVWRMASWANRQLAELVQRKAQRPAA